MIWVYWDAHCVYSNTILMDKLVVRMSIAKVVRLIMQQCGRSHYEGESRQGRKRETEHTNTRMVNCPLFDAAGVTPAVDAGSYN
jgi:hypothetical protein